MKYLIRIFLINFSALYITSQIIPAISINNGIKGLVIGTGAFMLANVILVPLIKILLLPLNLLTLGIFAWLSNILALYLLVTNVSAFKITTYSFPGLILNGFIIPASELSTFQVAIIASFILSLIIHFVNWLVK